jgi:hypothetical protein
MSWRAVPGPEGHALLAAPGRNAALALRRRWWNLAAFTAAMVLSEILIGVLKGSYERARPPGSLVVTTGTSFPSGQIQRRVEERQGAAWK